LLLDADIKKRAARGEEVQPGVDDIGEPFSKSSFLYIAGIEEKSGAPVMVDFSIDNVCMVTHYDESRYSTWAWKKDGIHDVEDRVILVQWSRGPKHPFDACRRNWGRTRGQEKRCVFFHGTWKKKSKARNGRAVSHRLGTNRKREDYGIMGEQGA